MSRQKDIELFKSICEQMNHASDKGYATVVLAVLKTKYRLLLPEEMEVSEIAYILNLNYKQVNFILKRCVGDGLTPSNKSILRTLAHYTNLVDHIPDTPIVPDDVEHEVYKG